MIKDIELPVTSNVMIAIMPLLEADQWSVLIVNQGGDELKNVLVNSTGSGIDEEGKKIQTSTLRHFLEDVAPFSSKEVELIDPSVFSLENEYWVSFWLNDKLHDHRFIFASNSISEEVLEEAPFCSFKAVLKRVD